MKKTFWLYYSNLLVTSVRCAVNATETEIIGHALDLWEKAPCCYALSEFYNPGEIRMMIGMAQIKT